MNSVHQILFYCYGFDEFYCYYKTSIAAINVSIKQEAVNDLKQAVAGLIEANKRCHYIRSVELDGSGIKDFFNIEQVKNFTDFSDENKDFVQKCAIVPAEMENECLIEDNTIYVKSVKIVRNSSIETISLEFELDAYESLIDENATCFHVNEKFSLNI